MTENETNFRAAIMSIASRQYTDLAGSATSEIEKGFVPKHQKLTRLTD